MNPTEEPPLGCKPLHTDHEEHDSFTNIQPQDQGLKESIQQQLDSVFQPHGGFRSHWKTQTHTQTEPRRGNIQTEAFNMIDSYHDGRSWKPQAAMAAVEDQCQKQKNSHGGELKQLWATPPVVHRIAFTTNGRIFSSRIQQSLVFSRNVKHFLSVPHSDQSDLKWGGAVK